jgi:hypothetical protein
MTEAIIKKLGVFDENTCKHRFTIILKKIMLDKPYHIHCDEDGELIDLRKSKSYAKLSYTDKLKQVKGFYTISISKSKSCDDKCYVKLPTKFDYNLATILQIAQKTISSKVVFVAAYDENEITKWYGYLSAIENKICIIQDWHLPVGYVYTFITEDLFGEDIPTPDRVLKQIKAREDKERKKQSRITLFETFILPGLDIEGIQYDRDDQAFWIWPDDAVKVFKKHIEEVIIPKLKEIGVQISIDEFNVQGLQYCRKIPLKKVKLDNIDDIEQPLCEGE